MPIAHTTSGQLHQRSITSAVHYNRIYSTHYTVTVSSLVTCHVSLVTTHLASVFMTSSMCLCLATIRSRHRPSSGSVLLQSSKYFPAVYQIFSPVDGVVADLLRGVEDGGEGGDQGGEAGLQPRAALHQLLKQRELNLGS